MNKTIIIVLSIILILLIILNHISITMNSSSNYQGRCDQTTFGCCPDGVNSRINSQGSNCPIYQAGPGYPTQHKYQHS